MGGSCPWLWEALMRVLYFWDPRQLESRCEFPQFSSFCRFCESWLSDLDFAHLTQLSYPFWIEFFLLEMLSIFLPLPQDEPLLFTIFSNFSYKWPQVQGFSWLGTEGRQGARRSLSRTEFLLWTTSAHRPQGNGTRVEIAPRWSWPPNQDQHVETGARSY